MIYQTEPLTTDSFIKLLTSAHALANLRLRLKGSVVDPEETKLLSIEVPHLISLDVDITAR
jgi:hypothetical protein